MYTALCSVSNRLAICRHLLGTGPTGCLHLPPKPTRRRPGGRCRHLVAGVPELAGKTLVAGVVDGKRLAHRPEACVGHVGDPVALRRLPYVRDVVLDTARAVLAGTGNRPGDALRSWLAFGAEVCQRRSSPRVPCATDTTRSPTIAPSCAANVPRATRGGYTKTRRSSRPVIAAMPPSRASRATALAAAADHDDRLTRRLRRSACACGAEW